MRWMLAIAACAFALSAIMAGCQAVGDIGSKPAEAKTVAIAVSDRSAQMPAASAVETERVSEERQSPESYISQVVPKSYQYEGYGQDYDSQGYQPYYGGGNYGNSFKYEGVRYDGGVTYTWYSQNALPGGGLTELNNSGRHVDASTGFIMDGAGYIAVASSDYPIGTVVDTPWGAGMVYDSGCAPGTIDIYTDF